MHFFAKFVQTVVVRPFTSTVVFAERFIKLLTWMPLKAGFYVVSGHYTEAAAYAEAAYLKTVKGIRDLLFTPSIAKRAFKDIFAAREEGVEDILRMPAQEYLNVPYTKSFQQFSSYLHGCKTFEVIAPEGIQEIPATTDPDLKTIMVSHLFKPDLMAINFGSPNVATFVTEANADGSIQTVKVDAKSLRRARMDYHPTNGKIQTGVFLIPTNLPSEAVNRFKEAATHLIGRKDVTCVNTNSRVLKEAGFSIESVEMEDIIFPQTLMEHLLFRNVYYTDAQGVKHKVHFDILNTTEHNLEKFFEQVDTAVVGTRLRHRRRSADTEENQRARGVAAKALIAEEEQRLLAMGSISHVDAQDLGRRKVTVSVPSFLGDIVARFWGRHTVYEVDLSDKKEEIASAFARILSQGSANNSLKLQPFPHKKPSMGTRLKRDVFFSKP